MQHRFYETFTGYASVVDELLIGRPATETDELYRVYELCQTHKGNII